MLATADGDSGSTVAASTRARLAVVCTLTALGMMLAGCSLTREREQVIDVPGDIRLLAVDVENFNGDVVVRRDANAGGNRAWIKGYVSVPATLTREQRDNIHEAVSLASSIDAGAESGDAPVGVLRVRGATEREQRDDHRLRIEIVAPRLDAVRVVNKGGSVEIMEVAGSVDVRNEGGGVLVRTSTPINDDMLILNEGGNVFVQAPEGTTGDLIIESLDGRAVLVDPFDEIRNQSLATRERTEAVLGDGRNLVDVRTTEGTVRFVLMEEPAAFSRALLIDNPHPLNWLTIPGEPRYKQNLPDDDVGDGLRDWPGQGTRADLIRREREVERMERERREAEARAAAEAEEAARRAAEAEARAAREAEQRAEQERRAAEEAEQSREDQNGTAQPDEPDPAEPTTQG